jgi:coenzyme F420-0:L-glutamate ligase/coenzyme F420-1:gamma-L-glutamate ligase
MANSLTLTALEGIPLVQDGDDLVTLITEALARTGHELRDGDVLVLAQKIVSKAEGRMVELASVTPSGRALKLAEEVDKDPRAVELILSESNEIVRHKRGVLIVEHRIGIVMANAGIDASNVNEDGGADKVLLLPLDPDASCEAIRSEIKTRTGVDVGVLVNDSVGRAWRTGTMGLAIGVAGLPSVIDLRGNTDLFGRELMVSEQAVADELASAASLLQGQGDEGKPVVLIRGYISAAPHQPARDLVRTKDQDMFR